MKIIVFGATGGVGQQVVTQALEKGIEVTAFVRTPSKMKTTNASLQIVQGDAFNKEKVDAAIAGHDAVVSCLGSSQGMKKSTELAEMTKNIVDGMQAHELNFTIVRPMSLTNEAFTGTYRESTNAVPEKSRSISRADVAHFIVKALRDEKYEHTSVGIAN